MSKSKILDMVWAMRSFENVDKGTLMNGRKVMLEGSCRFIVIVCTFCTFKALCGHSREQSGWDLCCLSVKIIIFLQLESNEMGIVPSVPFSSSSSWFLSKFESDDKFLKMPFVRVIPGNAK